MVNLARNPSTPTDAIATAWAVQNGIELSLGLGTAQEVSPSIIEAGDWGAVQFLSPYLRASFVDLASNKFFDTVAIGEIAHVGPGGQRIRDAFRRSAMPGPDGMEALWQHDTAVTQSLASEPDTYIVAKPEKAHLAERYWQQRSRLMFPNRIRLNTVRVNCVRLNTPAVGSSWSPCNIGVPEHDREALEKSICVYLNSSIGILALLGNRTNRVPSYPRFSLDDLRRLVVPNLTGLDESAVKRMAVAYGSLAGEPLLPLPQMDADAVRGALDDVVCDALDLDPERIATIRRHLAAEPSVTDRRYAG